VALNFPNTPTVNDVYSSGGSSWRWDGAKWFNTLSPPSGSLGTSDIFIGDAPPPSPQIGNLWWDSVSGNMYLWYDDGTSIQWVPTMNLPGSSSGGGTAAGPFALSDITNLQTSLLGTAVNGLLIPFYIIPTNPYSNTDVQRLVGLMDQYHDIPVLVVINVSNGPGTTANADYTNFIKIIQGAGGRVCGYIPTTNGTRTEVAIKSDIDKWLQLYPGINGVFFDEMSTNVTHVTLYKNCTDYAHSLKLSPTIGNPGTAQGEAFFANKTADIIIVYEDITWPSESVMNGMAMGGYADYSYTMRGALVYNQPVIVASELLALRKNVQWLYISNDSGSNPWDSLPTYLESLFQGLSPISPMNGGTGFTSYSQGDMLFAANASTIQLLPKSATATRYISNTGISNNPEWSQIDLSNGVTGILPIANGGTGIGTAAGAPWVETAGDLMTGKLTITAADPAGHFQINGTTKAFRILPTSVGVEFRATDLAVSAFQPLSIMGSEVRISPGGTDRAVFGQGLVLGGTITQDPGVGGISLLGTNAAASSNVKGMLFANRIYFKQIVGDDSFAGTIDYGGYDTTALSIVGAGTSPNRRVRIFENLTVGDNTSAGFVTMFNVEKNIAGVLGNSIRNPSGDANALALFRVGVNDVFHFVEMRAAPSHTSLVNGSSISDMKIIFEVPSGGGSRGAFTFSMLGQLRCDYVGGDGLQIATPVNTDSGIQLLNGNQSWLIHNQGFSSPGQFWIYDGTAGSVRLALDPGGNSFNTTGTWIALTSDRAAKRDISPYTTGLAEITQLNPVYFKYNGEMGSTDDDVQHFGFIAQDVEPHIPEVVSSRSWSPLDSDKKPTSDEPIDVKTLDPGRLIYAVINALKELNTRLKVLEAPAV